MLIVKIKLCLTNFILIKLVCISTVFCKTHFYRAMLSAVFAVVVCLSVCLSVTLRYCIKTAKRRITQITPQSCDVFKFSEISDNISETVQDRLSYNGKQIRNHGLSNRMTADDLE